MVIDREEEVKRKLYELWAKEAIRVFSLPHGWTEKRVSLGKGLIKAQGLAKLEEMLDTLEDFGINLEDFNNLKPTYDQVFEVYEAIKAYRVSVRFLRDLKRDMEISRNAGEWRNE